MIIFEISPTTFKYCWFVKNKSLGVFLNFAVIEYPRAKKITFLLNYGIKIIK